MLHADVKTRQVAVLRANYDFWYGIAEADDRLEPGEEPSLNADGFRYYLLYDKWPDGTRFWPDGSALTEQDAKETAERCSRRRSNGWPNCPHHHPGLLGRRPCRECRRTGHRTGPTEPATIGHGA